MSSLLATYSGASLAADYWLTLEQVGAADATATVAETAAAIDAIYGLDPCVDDAALVGGQEVETDEEGRVVPPLEEIDFWTYLNNLLTITDCEAEEGSRTEQVKVFRSHIDEPYKLVISGGTRVSTLQESETVTVTLSVSGSSLALDKNVSVSSYSWSRVRDLAGNIVNPPAITVSGNVLVFSYPVTGLLRLTYSAGFDLVTIRIHDEDDGDPGECNVLAFYHAAAYELNLTSTAVDENVEDAEDVLCRDNLSGGSIEIAGSPYCYELVTHYRKCECSREWAPEHDVEVEVGVTCPDEIRHDGRYCVGRRTQFAGFVGCGEYDSSLSDADFYNATCCADVSGVPPLCRHKYFIYSGTRGVDGGAENLAAQYGPGTTFVPVAPSDGVCGEMHVEYRVNARACCDDITPMSEHESNEHEIEPGGGVWILIEDGRPDNVDAWKWTASGGLIFANGHASITGGRRQQVSAPLELCENVSVTVSDGCDDLTVNLTNTGAEDLDIPPGDRVVAPEGFIYVSATGGVGPYYWSAGGDLTLVSDQGANGAMFEASESFCGTSSVTVSDSCGAVASAGIRSTDGYWAADPQHPTSGDPYCDGFGGEIDSAGYVVSGGSRAHVFITYPEGGCGGQTPGYCEPGNFIAEGDGLLSPEEHCLQIYASGGTWFTRWEDGCCIRCAHLPGGGESCAPLAGFSQAANLFGLWECYA